MGIMIWDNDMRMSLINLKNCESILKRENNIPDNTSLVILKYEKLTGVGSEKSIQYEIYNPLNNYQKLDLSACETSDIDISIPIDVSNEIKDLYNDLLEDGYDLFDRNSKFYLDICTPFTADNGADILLADRVYYFFSKVANLTVCPSNCQYATFSITSQYLTCQCSVSNENIDVNNTDKFIGKSLYNEKDYELKYTSYKTMKCYKLVFNLNYFKKNIGSIFLLILFFIFFGSLVYFAIKGISPLKVAISKLWFDGQEDEEKNNQEPNVKNKIKSSEKKLLTLKAKNPPKKVTLKSNNSMKNEKGQENKITNKQNDQIKIIPSNKIIIDAHGKFESLKNEGDTKMDNKNPISKDTNTRKTIKINASGTKSFYLNMFMNSDNKFKSKNDIHSEKTDDKPKKKPKKEKRRSKFVKEKPKYKKEVLESSMSIIEDNPPKNEIILDDYELNHLPYLDALELDKRNYCRTYCSILMRDQIILNTFCACNDYNLMCVKIAKLTLIIATIMAMNAFLFSDKAFHKLFMSGVHYYFSYHIIQILVSAAITLVVEVIVCYLTMTDRHIYEIKALPKKQINGEKIFNILKCIRTKLLSFYASTFIILLFYWYFVSAFCAVYPNSQKLYIVYCLISFVIFALIPFVVYAITTIFRVISMKDVNKKRFNCMYILGQSFPIF